MWKLKTDLSDSKQGYFSYDFLQEELEFLKKIFTVAY